MTQALGTFGVYGRPGDDELEVLTLADDYRQSLCTVLHERHKSLVHFRDEHFPGLFSAMAALESIKARIWEVEKRINKHHSDVRDRNAVTVQDEAELTELRERRKHATVVVQTERRPWIELQKEFRRQWKDKADWKNVKSIERRRELYGCLEWDSSTRPVAAYAQLVMSYDLQQRDLSREFQSRGLHSAIRAEIVEASKPKLTRTSPGMRYQYHRKPEPRPWEKLTLQIAGGLSVWDAIAGKNSSLLLSPKYTNHKASGAQTVYEVSQSIASARENKTIRYTVKFHRELPLDAIIQRWTLVVRESGKRYVVPILKNHGLSKQIGNGVLGYDITWRRVEGGLQICHFLGEHVNERLILPDWLLRQRMCVATVQQELDADANQLLASRGCTPQVNERQGVAALESYCAKTPADTEAINKLFDFNHDLKRARKTASRALRCIESIYKTVAHRVCGLHAELVTDPIDLAKLKRYDTRDLLRADPLPSKSREYLHAVAPGKLKALIEGWGLASVEVLPESVETARESDLFTSYVRSLGRKTGAKQGQRNRRSQSAIGTPVE
jgi:hypothetical protein